MILLSVTCRSTIFRYQYLFISFLKTKYKLFSYENQNNATVQVQVNKPFSADFTENYPHIYFVQQKSLVWFPKCSLNSNFHLPNMFYLLQRKPFKIDSKCFLFFQNFSRHNLRHNIVTGKVNQVMKFGSSVKYKVKKSFSSRIMQKMRQGDYFQTSFCFIKFYTK